MILEELGTSSAEAMTSGEDVSAPQHGEIATAVTSQARFDYPRPTELTPEGDLVLQEVISLVLSQELQTSPELRQLLLDSISDYKPGLLNQLGLLNETPVFAANQEQGGHSQYEVTMLRVLLRKREDIKKFLGCDDRIIVDMFFMIIASDVGKAGPSIATHGEPSSVVRRMYNQALFFEAHIAWLKQCDPAQLPSELSAALDSINKTPTAEGTLSDWDMVFKEGFFVPIPLELYLYVIKQVAKDSAGDNEKLSAVAEQLFTLAPQEYEFLKKQGWDPSTTRIRQFFTRAHIKFGNDFLLNDQYTTAQQQEIAPLALAHHFTQGILPDSISVTEIVQNPQLMRICAFLEILDKVEAAYHRFAKKDKEKAKTYAKVECAYQLKINYPVTNPENTNETTLAHLTEIYTETLQFMDEQGVFDALD